MLRACVCRHCSDLPSPYELPSPVCVYFSFICVNISYFIYTYICIFPRLKFPIHVHLYLPIHMHVNFYINMHLCAYSYACIYSLQTAKSCTRIFFFHMCQYFIFHIHVHLHICTHVIPYSCASISSY